MDANKTEILSEIMRFCKSNNMTSYYELQAYAFHEPTGKPVGLIFKINLIGTTCKTDRISLALSE